MRFSVHLLMLLSAASMAYCQSHESAGWKGFSAPVLGGGNFTLGKHSGSVVLLTFLALGASNQSSSRAAAVVLNSLNQQYHNRGLLALIVDETTLNTYAELRPDDLKNRTADWQLTMPILIDRDGGRARVRQIRTLPAFVLLSPSGKELGRWVGYARTAVLAQAIERALGGSLGSLPDSAVHPEQIPAK